jgi:hypothetical protein
MDQPLVPVLSYRDASAWIPIREHLMALSNQPLMQLSGTLPVLAGIADEDPGHRSSR